MGVILRRGPTKWTELILWHTDTDIFERGQWFKGRIYERYCDLSPDGSKFLYNGTKYHLRKFDPSMQMFDPYRLSEWTAISKPPYFTALALWSHNANALEGSFGVFLDNDTVALWGNSTQLAKGHLPSDFKVVDGSQDTKDISRQRLPLNGWLIEQEWTWQYPPGKLVQPEVRRKGNGSSKYDILLETDFYYHNYSLEDEESKERIRFPKATWMDLDQQGRLVFTEEGKIYANSGDKLNPQVVCDFNADEFSEIIAPDWAREW